MFYIQTASSSEEDDTLLSSTLSFGVLPQLVIFRDDSHVHVQTAHCPLILQASRLQQASQEVLSFLYRLSIFSLYSFSFSICKHILLPPSSLTHRVISRGAGGYARVLVAQSDSGIFEGDSKTVHAATPTQDIVLRVLPKRAAAYVMDVHVLVSATPHGYADLLGLCACASSGLFFCGLFLTLVFMWFLYFDV